jgi:phospholipid/cholesterol/gamma-HCH transport system substrate-binding protein
VKAKFNKFERVAGFFVMFAVGGVVLTAASVAVKQGWFAQKVYHTTVFAAAEGIHSGTAVQMAGLRAGSVEDVELQADNTIKVNFYVLGKFEERIRTDSQAQLIRPFIIGDRVLELTVGTPTAAALAQNEPVASRETLDIMTLLSGRSLGTNIEKLTVTLQNLARMVEALTSKDRTQSLVRIFDRLDPLVENVDVMAHEITKLSRQATYRGNLQTVVSNLSVTTHEINSILPELNKENPELAKDLSDMTKNLASLSQDFRVLGPALRSVGPDLPQATKRAVEALNETVIMMKAMQKSLLLRGSVQEVRDEEAKARSLKTEDARVLKLEDARVPASQP